MEMTNVWGGGSGRRPKAATMVLAKRRRREIRCPTHAVSDADRFSGGAGLDMLPYWRLSRGSDKSALFFVSVLL